MQENQRVALTRRLLREGLVRLLREKSLDAITVTALCAEAQINRTTFYKHYATPQEVMTDISLELMKEMHRFYTPPRNLEELRTCMVRICEYVYANAETVRMLIRSRADKEIAAAIGEIYQHMYAERERFVGTAMEDEAALRLSAAFLGGGSYFLLRRWLMEEIEKPPREIAELLFGMLNLDHYWRESEKMR